MATPLLYRSPKRKRDASESDCCSPPASPTSTVSVTSLQEARLREEHEAGRYSPRTAVAGRLRELAIRESSLYSEAESSDLETKWQDHSLQSDGTATASSDVVMQADSSLRESDPGPAKQNSIIKSTEQQDGMERASSAPAGKTEKAPGSRKKIKSLPASKSRSRRKSPPPDISEDSLTWHDSEITGHNLDDPNDDGYGINGIGFKPTAAIAWARSQKRQQQVAEWKKREAREARERRRERREGINRASIRDVPDGTVQKKVKFDLDVEKS
ncbi:hypothetical protein VTN77DRAFT_3094 [Rasamsonia byssochlamydoides]|uniref:uncharacterized protein n=1 Tax=Rasamsonia byssochlamydoides TaxID=89139 RepID=UPI0037437034